MSAIQGLSRVILFVRDVAKVQQFFQSNFGMEVIGTPEAGWVQLRSGGCELALHKAGSVGVGSASPVKLVFFSQDVESARKELVAKGIKMGKIQTYNELRFCDGADPEGNPFQISNR